MISVVLVTSNEVNLPLTDPVVFVTLRNKAFLVACKKYGFCGSQQFLRSSTVCHPS